MLELLLQICYENGCYRLRSRVLSWNELSKRLYSEIKAENLLLTERWELMHIMRRAKEIYSTKVEYFFEKLKTWITNSHATTIYFNCNLFIGICPTYSESLNR